MASTAIVAETWEAAMDIDFRDIVDAEYECRQKKLADIRPHQDQDETTAMGPGGFGLSEADVLNLAYVIIACVLARLGVPSDGDGALPADYASTAAGGSLQDFDTGLVDWIVKILQDLGHVVAGAAGGAG